MADDTEQNGQPQGIDEAGLLAGIRAMRGEEPAPEIPRPSEEAKEEAGVEPKGAPASAPEETLDKAQPDPEAPRVADEVLRISKMQKRLDQEHRERMADIEKERATLTEQREAMQKMQEQLRAAMEDPFEFYKAQGMEPKDVAKFIAARAGLLKDGVTPTDTRLQLQQQQTKSELTKQIEALKKQVEEMSTATQEREKQAEVQQQVSKIRSQYGQWLTSVPENLQHVSRAAKNDPDRVTEQMLSVLAEWGRRNPDETQLPDPEQVAEWLEQAIVDQYGVFFSAQEQAKQAAKAPSQESPPSKVAETLPTHDLQPRAGQEDWPDDPEEQILRIAAKIKAGNIG